MRHRGGNREDGETPAKLWYGECMDYIEIGLPDRVTCAEVANEINSARANFWPNMNLRILAGSILVDAPTIDADGKTVISAQRMTPGSRFMGVLCV